MRTLSLLRAARPGRWVRLSTASIALALVGCGGGGGGAASGTVTGLRIQETVADVQGGASPTSVQLTLVADFADGTSATLGGSGPWPFGSSPATWSSDAPGTATVAGGKVTGVLAGRTVIRASLSGYAASVPARVSCVPASTPARVPVSDTGTGLTLGGGTQNNAGRSIAIDTLGRVHVVWFDPATGVRYAR